MTYSGLPYSNNYEKRLYEASLKLTDVDKCSKIQHEIYPRIGTSDRQRAYLLRHNIKHVRKDGEYR